ncbi:MAG: FHA domain-containing protein [Planctomycetia bacterium]|nr:FHA domain-containing protein [Planctomycetia bacterium]
MIDASAVSRQHAAITVEGGHASIEDLRSRNGTVLNGRPLSAPHRLAHGDHIQICEQLLVYSAGERAGKAGQAVESSSSIFGSQTSLFDEVVEGNDHDSLIVSQLAVGGADHDEGSGEHARSSA